MTKIKLTIALLSAVALGGTALRASATDAATCAHRARPVAIRAHCAALSKLKYYKQFGSLLCWRGAELFSSTRI